MYRFTLKKFVVFSFIVLSEFALAKQSVCYVSSNLGAILPRANDLPTQFSGFELALSRYKDKIDFKVYRDSRTNSAIYSKPWLIKEDCLIVVGIVSSKDSMLMGPILQSAKLFGFSSTSITKKADKYAGNFRSLSMSSRQYIDDLLKYRPKSRLVVIHDPKSFFSVNQKDLIGDNERVLYMELKSLEISEFRKDDVLYFTTYPFASIPALVRIKQKGLRNEIIGNPAWGETHTFAKIKEKLPVRQMYFLTPFWKESLSKPATIFRKEYLSKFGKEPDYDSYLDYDVARFFLQCFMKYVSLDKSQLKEKLYQCLKKDQVYKGITGEYRFRNGEAHPWAKQKMYRLLL